MKKRFFIYSESLYFLRGGTEVRKLYSPIGGLRVLFSFFFFLFLSVFIFPNSVSALTLPPNNLGLKTYWSLNENSGSTITDFSGNGITGTLVSSPASVTGKSGLARSFNGTSQYITGSTKTVVNPSQTNATISAWVKVTTFGYSGLYNRRVVMQNIDGSNGFQFALGVDSDGSNTFSFAFNDGGVSTQRSVTATTWQTNRWYHVVGTYDTGTNTIEIYVDGVSQSLTSGSALGYGAANNSLHVGIRTDGFGPYSGSVDELRIYNRKLSSTEVRSLYTSRAVFFSGSLAGVTNGLIGHWTFDGGQTDWTTGKTNDFSGKGYHGDIKNGATSTTPTLGSVGQAFNFNGSTYVTTQDITDLDGSGELTCAFWVYFDDTRNTADRSIIRKDGSFTCSQSGALTGSGWRFVLWAPTIVVATVEQSLIPKNQWVHIVHRWKNNYNSGIPELFVNGVKAGNFNLASTGTITNSATLLRFGNSDSLVENFFGKLDDVRIYNRWLTNQEIGRLYNLGKNKVNTSSNAGVTSGLVGWWTMDGGDTNWATGIATDKSGNGNSGTLLGMSTSTSPRIGKIGQALNFNGSNSAIDVGSGSSIDDLGPMTISVWIKPNSSGSSGLAKIIAKGTGIAANMWQLTMVNGTPCRVSGPSVTNSFCFTKANSSAGSYSVASGSSEALELGVWQHVLITWDGTSGGTGINLYKNGTLLALAETFGSGSLGSDAASSVFIGNRSDLARSFDGTIDDVRIYNRVLSRAEINQLYLMGR